MMKTTVKNVMMSMALMGCLMIGASDASAQGRNRSQGGSSSRNQSTAVSRSSDRSGAPSLSRSSSRATREQSTPQVNRGSASSRSNSISTPSNRSNGTRPDHGTATRSGGDNKAKVNRDGISTNRNRGTKVATKPGNATMRDNSRGTRPDGNNDRNMGNDRRGNNDRNGTRPGNMGNDRRGNNDRNGNRPGNNHPGNNNYRDHRGGQNGGRGFSPNNRFDYGNHPHRDQFKWNFSHRNWSRPLPPPVRAHRPAPLMWRRPVIPVGWHPLAGAPVIDRILGLTFGTLYDASLSYLYSSGYYIDGYDNGIIYLRDVPMMDLYWPDVMLSYEYDRLANAQFVYHSSYYDRARFDRVYRSLCRVYGPPVFRDGMTISWYGGNNNGWVTLSMEDNYGDYYTTMSIGY